jgi:hypothetical protein
LDYVNYHNPQFDIIITVNQPLNAQDAATKLINESYIDYAKAVGPIRYVNHIVTKGKEFRLLIRHKTYMHKTPAMLLI